MVKIRTCVALGAAATMVAACALPPMPVRITPVPAQASPIATSTTSPTTQAAAPDGEMQKLRELAERLIAPSYFFGPGEPPPKPELFVARVPPLFPDGLPIPPDARVLGGVTRGDWGAELIVDATQSPADAVEFVVAGLTAAGWQTPTFQYQPGGFVQVQVVNATLCQSKDGPAIFVGAAKLDDGTTDLRYSLQTFKNQPAGSYTPCGAPPAPGPPAGLPEFPVLVAPAGAKQSLMGGSGSISTQAQYAMVETELDAQALRDHYDAQLKGAGWSAGESGGDNRAAWSTWKFKDRQGKEQRGTLFVLHEDASKPGKFVYLQVTWGMSSGSASTTNAVRETIRQLP